MDQCGILFNKYVLPSERALGDMQREHAAIEQRRRKAEQRAQVAKAKLDASLHERPGGATGLRATVVAREPMRTQPVSPGPGAGPGSGPTRVRVSA